MKRSMQLSLLLLILLVAVPCMAAVYSYGDIYKEWPGYETLLRNFDEWGSPKVEGAEVKTRANGSLETITIFFDKDYGNGLYNPGDSNSLFINSNWAAGEAYDTWDFYVYGVNASDPNNPTPPVYSADFYVLPGGAPAYTYASVPIFYRFGHPNGIDTTGLNPTTGYLSDFIVDPGFASVIYAFDDGKILLANDFVIGYTPYCANDVFLTPIPEPSAFLLLGAGLVFGAARFRKLNR